MSTITQRAVTLVAILCLVRGSTASCSSSQMQCISSSTCINKNYICDGKSDCPEGEDESRDLCDMYYPHPQCRKGAFRCGSTSCYEWSSCASYSHCSLNTTMCTAIANRKLPEFALKKVQPTPPPPSLSVEDMNAFLTVVNETQKLSASKCPMFYSNISDNCLALLPFKMPWSEALEACRSISGHLVEFDDVKQYTETVTYFQKNGFMSDFWIGGFFDLTYGDWRWYSGDAMTMGTPYWTMIYETSCTQRLISKALGPDNGECFHYHQSPRSSKAGDCAALQYRNMFFISGQNCDDTKKPLCLHNTVL